MPDLQNTLLVETLMEALETMAFVPLMPAEGETPTPAEARRVHIDFARPEPGSLELIAPAGLGRLLAANILGTGPDDPEAASRGDDALRELLNITCGTLLRRCADSGQTPQMGLPVAQPCNAEQWQAFLHEPDVHVLDAEGHVFAARLLGL